MHSVNREYKIKISTIQLAPFVERYGNEPTLTLAYQGQSRISPRDLAIERSHRFRIHSKVHTEHTGREV